VVIIGDSLSIGYTPLVQTLLEDIASVQHAPWDVSDGGAEETAYGLQCVDLWLASPSGMAIAPDLIWFNFGMHDYVPSCSPGHGCVPGQSGNTTVYPSELTAIAKKVVAFANALPKRAKVIFALTTPYLCDASIDNTIAHTLNTNASAIMKQLGIQLVDLHTPIVAACGAPPVQECFGISGCFCPHCPGAGYQYIVTTTIAPAIRAALQGKTGADNWN
jgi:acyl-CoA thioesterase-1